MPVEAFLKIWNGDGVSTNSWFTQEELQSLAEQLDTVTVYGNYYYFVKNKSELKIACFSRGVNGMWRTESFDSLWDDTYVEDEISIALDVDILSANENALPAPAVSNS